MTKQKKGPAEVAGEKRERPPHGGRFVRDPETGKLECVERTDTAAARQGAAAAEPGSGTANVSGDAAASGSVSSGENTAGGEG